MPTELAQLKKWYKEHQDLILEDFFTFLSFRSISTDPQYKKDCLDCAHWLKEYLNNIGLETVLWEGPGLPVVFGQLSKAGPKRPTLLLYHHYDVQPVDPLELWKSDPFKPVVRNNQVYARGAVDNKGQCFYSITALKAMLEMAKDLNVNIKIFIEGEEECSSLGTTAIIEQHKKELAADHLLVIDFDMPAAATPGVTLGMRGLITLNVECSNSSVDLHSGVHGGIALNPNRALVKALSCLWDSAGRIAIPHFYDAIKPLSPKDLSSIDMSFDVEKYVESFGVKAFGGEEGCSLKESNWLRPSLEINGMWGGYTGIGFKTVIPSSSFAKISCRLVPSQDPEKIGALIAKFLRSHVPDGIEMKVDVHHGAPSFRSSMDSSIVKVAALAYEEVFGKPCRYVLCGASVPIVVNLAKASGAEVAMIGVGLVDDDIHAPNEHFGLDRFALGFLSIGKMIDRLTWVI